MLRVRAWLAMAAFAAAVSADPDPNDTLLLAQPAVSAKHLAFVYADDLWIADADGGKPRRLTAHNGVESHPAFSPDGATLAFSGQYDGNTDVYTVPVAGGAPKRITHHPAADIVHGFTADGLILFGSQREVFTRRYSQFFTVPITGGMPTKLPIPTGWKASLSADGKRFAYTVSRDVFEQWKNYRGGTHARIWICDLATLAVEEIPQPEGRCNDTEPRWFGDTLLFRSDRDGEFNVHRYSTATRKVQRLTAFDDFPVLALAVGGGRAVIEQAGRLHALELPPGETGYAKTTPLRIGVAADLVEARPRFLKAAGQIRGATLSPTAARAAFEMRGEIFSVPAEKGDARNLTQTTGAHERSPAWSPDGKTIAYLSDESGEYQLCLRPQNGKSPPRVVKLAGSGFYSRLTWSPDSKKLLYRDQSSSLFWLDVATGQAHRICPPARRGLDGGDRPSSWSPDSQWVAYALENEALIQTAFIYSLAEDKSRPATDGLSEVGDPVFDASGKHLFFLGSTDSGLSKHGFMLSSQDARAPRQSLYALVLRKDLPSPLARESDEEKPEPAADESAPAPKDKNADAPKEPGAGDEPPRKRGPGMGMRGPAKPAVVKIDFDGLQHRVVALPLAAGNYADLQAGPAGQVYYLERSEGGGGGGGGGSLKLFDLAKRRSETTLASASEYILAPDAKKMLYRNGRDWFIHGAGAPSGDGPAAAAGGGRAAGGRGRPGGAPAAAPVADAGSGDKRLALDGIDIKIDPRAEWPQIYAEAWRINRDYFYAPNMHGADWPALRKKYEPFLAHAATRNDVNRIVQWLCSELAVGHHRGGGGDRVYSVGDVAGGLLGADYEIKEGRYCFKRVYGALNWNPDLRAPLTAPGVDVKAGEFLLAVQGKELRPPTEIYAVFENTAGKTIELTVGPTADGKGSRTVSVEPLGDETDLRNRAWVEGNLEKVHKATDGKVAYVYVPDTGRQGLTYFKRYFFPQVDKQAVIVDERFNAGGQLADYYIEALRRPFAAYWAPRHGADWITPGAAVYGPKVMIIDENAGSGGDLLPWMFRKYGMGKLIGKRTWGGLVGVGGYPALMDGGTITAPHFAIWTTEQGWVVENEGVPPDIDIEQKPADLAAGRDPQLEKAIEVILAELKANPPKPPVRPPYPIRVRKAPPVKGAAALDAPRP